MRALLLLTAALATAPAFAQDPAAPLKRVPKEGDVTKYKLTVDTEVSGMTVKYAAKVTEKVTKVNPDGSFTVSSEQGDQVLTLNGQESSGADQVGAPQTTTFLADGTVSQIDGDKIGPPEYRMASIQTLVWPKEAVTTGAKWEADIKGDDKKGTVDTHLTYEIVGKETVANRTAYKITFEGKEKTGEAPASAKGTVWVDAATGLMLKTAADWANAPIAGYTISGKVSIEIAE